MKVSVYVWKVVNLFVLMLASLMGLDYLSATIDKSEIRENIQESLRVLAQEGDNVRGKRLVASFTSGTPAETYVEGGLQSFPMDYFMYPLIALANHCGMKWDGYTVDGWF